MKGKTLLVMGLIVVLSNAITAAYMASKSAPTVSSNPAAVPAAPGAPKLPPSPEVQIIFTQLNNNMEPWSGLGGGDKSATVEQVMQLFKDRENIAIMNTADFYVKKIDEVLVQNPSMRALTLPTLVKILSVMEYDFYNGQNKDELAQQVLGPQIYEENKRRLGLT